MDTPWYEPLGISPHEPAEHGWQWGDFRLHLRAEAGTVTVEAGLEGTDPAPTRYLRRADRDLVLTARTADRSVVTRPAVPLVVLGDGRATIFVSSPMWVGVAEAGNPPFAEFPTTPPKSTWLGATPQAGDLAYATRTRGRADLANLANEAGRLITQVELVNPLDDPWSLERVEVPMPHLAVYACEGPRGSGLWTSSVVVERRDRDEAEAQVSKEPPDSAGTARHLAEPRQISPPRLSLRALGAWGWS